MNSSQRLALNTIATYGRSVFALALILFSSRWVLNSLGATDYGLFSLVGSVIVFITFLNTVMAGSVSRFFAYSIGQGDSAEITAWFNTAVCIHLCFACTLVLIGLPVGEYVITNVFSIPPDRISTCLWVFRISLISAFVSMNSIPFVAMFTAQQRIAELAVWGILQATLAFALAFSLTQSSGDLLLFYAIGMVAIIVFIQVSQIVRALCVFDECKVVTKLWFDIDRVKKIFSFATWNLVGNAGTTLRDQGAAILLNLFYGPTVNAAFGIARQVSTQTSQLSAALLGAFSPEITASEGRGERDRMLSLSHRTCKLGAILVLLFAVPLIVEMDYVLQLWLRTPPPYTATLCRLILCAFLITRLSSGYMMAINAAGKIAACQATVGISLALTLPLAWLFLKMGYPPTSVGLAFVITSVVSTLGRVFWLRRLFGEPAGRWFKVVLLPCLGVALVALGAALAPGWLMPPSFARLASASILSLFATSLATWVIAFDKGERAFILQNLTRLFSKMTQAYSRA